MDAPYATHELRMQYHLLGCCRCGSALIWMSREVRQYGETFRIALPARKAAEGILSVVQRAALIERGRESC